MSAKGALAAAPNEPQNDAANGAEAEVKNEGETAQDVAVEPAAVVPAEKTAIEPEQHPQDAVKANAERILNAEGLPAGMRERLASVAAASGEGKLPVDEVVKAIEESLPEFLRAYRAEAAPSKHPAGEVFFRGDNEELSDEQAEEIAQRQLARSGLLKGQRVRVGD